MRRSAIFAIAMLLALPTIGAQELPSGQPSFTAKITMVEVAASVLDSHGNFVSGLRPSDFELLIDRRPVPIELFVEVDGPPATDQEGRFVLILFDDVATDPVLTRRMKDIARSLAERMDPLDEVAILGLNGDAMKSTRNREEILAHIDRFSAFGKAPAPMRPAEHTMNAIADLVRQMDGVDRRRKVIVAIGASGLFDVPKPVPNCPGTTAEAWLDAVRTAARHNVAVYVIDPRGLRGSSYSDAIGFASETGGLAFVNTNQFDRAVDEVWSDISRYYLLGYAAPENEHQKKLGRLSVRVSVPDAQVRARRNTQ